MKEILNHLIAHKTLTQQQAKEVLKNLALGSYPSSQVAAFMTVYLMRSITVEELRGFREAMLELCVPVDLSEYDAMDLCGTGETERIPSIFLRSPLLLWQEQGKRWPSMAIREYLPSVDHPICSPILDTSLAQIRTNCGAVWIK